MKNKPVNKHLKIYIHRKLEDNFFALVSLIDSSKNMDEDTKSEVIEGLLCWALDNCKDDIKRPVRITLEQRLAGHPRVSPIDIHRGTMSMKEGWITFNWPDIKYVNEIVKGCLLTHGFEYHFAYQSYFLRCTDMKLFNTIYNNLINLKGI